MYIGTNKKKWQWVEEEEEKSSFHFNGLCIRQTAYHLHSVLTEIINIPLPSQQIKYSIIQLC